jgi:hypothetical protein
MHLLLPSPHACPQGAGLYQSADPEISLSVLPARDWRNVMTAFQYGTSLSWVTPMCMNAGKTVFMNRDKLDMS